MDQDKILEDNRLKPISIKTAVTIKDYDQSINSLKKDTAYHFKIQYDLIDEYNREELRDSFICAINASDFKVDEVPDMKLNFVKNCTDIENNYTAITELTLSPIKTGKTEIFIDLIQANNLCDNITLYFNVVDQLKP